MSVFARVDAVEPGEGLHGVEAGQHLVHVHRVQQRLVEAGLELLGHDQHLVVVAGELLGGLRLREAVHRRLGELDAVPSITVPENATRAPMSS